MNNFEKLAYQLMYLMEKNKVSLGLASTKDSFQSDHYDKARLIIAWMHTHCKNQELIDPKAKLFPFVQTLRPFFDEAVSERGLLLKKLGYPENFSFPYPKESFLINDDFHITDEMVEKEIALRKKKMGSKDQPAGTILTGAVVEHDNIEMYRDVEGSLEGEAA